MTPAFRCPECRQTEAGFRVLTAIAFSLSSRGDLDQVTDARDIHWYDLSGEDAVVCEESGCEHTGTVATFMVTRRVRLAATGQTGAVVREDEDTRGCGIETCRGHQILVRWDGDDTPTFECSAAFGDVA